MSTHAVLTRGVDLGWLDAFTTDWLAAWNAHEPERLLALMTEDVVYDDAAWPATMRGHAEARAFLDATWRAFPDLTFELVEGPYIRPGAEKAAFHWRGRGTLTGRLDPPGFAPNGRSIVFEGVDLHEYRDGRVARLRIEFDMLDVGRQLGLMPAAGSKAERGMAAAQRAVTRIASRR
jgi:steroid delta-isomerase-like uncharacterized protein